jgi:hypothetical protein
VKTSLLKGDRRDRMVDGFTTSYAIIAYHHRDMITKDISYPCLGLLVLLLPKLEIIFDFERTR